LLNSWGSNWGDKGFFKLENLNILSGVGIIDTFYYIEDLTKEEVLAYKENSAKLLKEHTSFSKDILKKTEFKCLICNQKSFTADYYGDLVDTRCPRCGKTFKTRDLG
jgi:predicted metalloendopeptidase